MIYFLVFRIVSPALCSIHAKSQTVLGLVTTHELCVNQTHQLQPWYDDDDVYRDNTGMCCRITRSQVCAQHKVVKATANGFRRSARMSKTHATLRMSVFGCGEESGHFAGPVNRRRRKRRSLVYRKAESGKQRCRRFRA